MAVFLLRSYGIPNMAQKATCGLPVLCQDLGHIGATANTVKTVLGVGNKNIKRLSILNKAGAV